LQQATSETRGKSPAGNITQPEGVEGVGVVIHAGVTNLVYMKNRNTLACVKYNLGWGLLAILTVAGPTMAAALVQTAEQLWVAMLAPPQLALLFP
jgi:hypothetical protein